MNKKLLAAAITAAVVAAPAAFAESVVYGKFHTSYDGSDFKSGRYGSGQDRNNYSLESRASRLGFKGSEDLGNGLKAIYQAEFSVQTDGNDGSYGQDGGDGWGGQRNTFIGLASDWGTVLAGRHDTPAKVAFYGAGTEVLGDSVLDLNRGNTLFAGQSSQAPIGVFSEYRADNAVAYVSPSFAGFTVLGAFIPGEDRNDTGEPGSSKSFTEGDSWADHYSFGAIFGSNMFKASAGYQQTKVNKVKQKVWQVGGSVDLFDAFRIGANYENTDNFGQNKGDDYEAWAGTVKWTFGNNALMGVYTYQKVKPDNGGKLKTDGWGLGGEHNFSKRTKAYVAYASADVNDDTDITEFDFGGDDKVWSLGMIHSF
jgi:predicted porin